MSVEFKTEFFAANRRRLQSLFTGTAPIILTANGLLQRNSDITYPFRQDSSFWYLTGIEEPDIILVIDRTKEYLIVSDRDDSRKAFDGDVDYGHLVECSGVSNVYGEKEGWKILNNRLKKVKHVATLSAPKAYESRYGMYTNPSRTDLIDRIKQSNSDLALLDIRPHITRMRMIKQPQEILAIKKAVKITEQAFNKVSRKISAATNESEIQKLFDKHFVQKGVEHAYQPIVAAGKNACTLHYVSNNQTITPGDLVLIDAGSEFNNYSSDITRTFATKPPTKRQREVYAAVLEVYDFALSIMRVGISIKDYEQKVAQFMGEKLRELGLIKAIEPDELRAYYPHATSHFLGLDTHDIADYERPLEAGMVLTIEPGIYIPEESIGIRIEDDVLITSKGVNVLSKHLPKQLD